MYGPNWLWPQNIETKMVFSPIQFCPQLIYIMNWVVANKRVIIDSCKDTSLLAITHQINELRQNYIIKCGTRISRDVYLSKEHVNLTATRQQQQAKTWQLPLGYERTLN